MSKKTVSAVIALMLAGGNLFQQPALAEETEEALAMQLANPVAALISVPFQFNYNQNLGPVDNGEQWQIAGLPQPLALGTATWSPDQRHLAFTQVDARAGRRAAANQRFDSLLHANPGNRAVAITYAQALNEQGGREAGQRALAVLRPLLAGTGEDPLFQQANAVVQDPRFYSCVANMVLLPTPLKAFTDAMPEVKAMLRLCARALYGWQCDREELAATNAALDAWGDWSAYPASWPRRVGDAPPPGVMPLNDAIRADARTRLARIRRDLVEAGPLYPRESVREALAYWRIEP